LAESCVKIKEKLDKLTGPAGNESK